MKKFVRPLLIISPILIILWVVVLYWQDKNQAHISPGSQESAPEKMLKMGPVVEGATWTETIGDVTFQMKASRLWVKKSKTFGFDNALFRKMAADHFFLAVSKKGEKILAVSKAYLEMPLSQKRIKITNPKVLFPANMNKIDSIIFDRQSLSVHVRRYGRPEEIWNLEKM